jgi:PAS domain S-box-containing protein
MKDKSVTKHELIEEISTLKQRIHELEHSEAELKRVEEALIQSEERYRTLVENATDIVFKTDDTGHFTFVNPAALRITGYEADEIIGKHFRKYIRPDMREDVIKLLMKQLKNRVQNTYYEFVLISDRKSVV